MTPPDERRSSDHGGELDRTFERIRRDLAHLRWMRAAQIVIMGLLA